MIHDALTNLDERYANLAAAAVVEVIDNLDPARPTADALTALNHVGACGVRGMSE